MVLVLSRALTHPAVVPPRSSFVTYCFFGHSSLEDLAVDVGEAVDVVDLAEHVLDALLHLGILVVALGPRVQLNVAALLLDDGGMS